MHLLLRRPVALWRRHPLGLGLAAGLVAVLILGLGAGLAVVRLRSAHAATTNVTDCSQFGHTGDAGGTLYDALENPAPSSGDIIQFTCSGTITIPASQDAFTAPIAVAHTLAFNATGQSVTLDGGGTVQVFTVASTGQLTIEHLTVAHGGAEHGGGLEDDGGTVTITDSTFSDNQANALGVSVDKGGGLYAAGGAVTITGSTFSGNQAGGEGAVFGGGLYAAGGTVTITGSTFSGNGAGGNVGLGGGLYADDSSGGTVTITGSTFSGNVTQGGDHGASGGGLGCTGGAVTITTSTFSGNRVDAFGLGGSGGGIDCGSDTLTITNSTVAGNSVTESAPLPVTGTGGGLATHGTATTIIASTITDNQVTDPFSAAGATGGGLAAGAATTVADSIVAGNSADGGDPNCSGMPTDHGYNLEDSGVDPSVDCGFSSANHDRLGATHLHPLGSNGGPTQTVLPLFGSPAIDAIPSGTNGCGTTLTVDQRGVSRPQGAGCTIGAVEVRQGTLTLTRVEGPIYVAPGVPVETFATRATIFSLNAVASADGVVPASASYCVVAGGGACTTFTTVPAANLPATFSLTGGDGPYTISAFATDGAGDQGAIQTQHVTLDDTPPAATQTTGQPQATGSDGIVEVNSTTPLTLSATDGGSGVASVSYRFFPQGASAPAFTTVDASSATFHLTGSDGVYEVDYDAADHLGNDPAHTVFLRLANATLVNGADVAAGQGGGAPPPGANGGPTGSQQGGSSTSGNSAGSNPAPAPGARQHTGRSSSGGGLPLWLGATLAALLALLAIGGGSFVLVRTQRNRQS